MKPDSQNIPWKRLFAEGAAIIVSILLAFGIDAWWQDRQTSQEEQEILLGLQEEFSAIHRVLERHLGQHRESLVSLENVIILIENGGHGETGTIVEAALRDLLTPNTTDISNGTLHALLGSGRLEMLSSRTLRKSLVGWEREIGEVWDDQTAHAKMVYEVHIPYFINEGFATADVWRPDYDDWNIPTRSVAGNPDERSRLLGDPKFRSMVEIRYSYRQHLTEEYEAAIEAVDAILAEVGKSIQR